MHLAHLLILSALITLSGCGAGDTEVVAGGGAPAGSASEPVAEQVAPSGSVSQRALPDAGTSTQTADTGGSSGPIVEACAAGRLSCGDGVCCDSPTAICVGGACCDPVANCAQRACGDDGCGGQCEALGEGWGCEPGQICDAYACLSVDDCNGALPICVTEAGSEAIALCAEDGTWVEGVNCADNPEGLNLCVTTQSGAVCAACREDSHCPGDQACVTTSTGATCAECILGTDCPGDASCVDNQCVSPCAKATPEGFVCNPYCPGDCEAGQACTFANGAGLCVPPGDDATGEGCSGISCAAGHACIALAGEPEATCRRFCIDDAACGPESTCSLNVNTGISTLDFCSAPAPGCDALGGDAACDAWESCVAGQCVPCVPECGGIACGDDGCGGSCGSCPEGASCESGQCQSGACLGEADMAIIAELDPNAVNAAAYACLTDEDISACVSLQVVEDTGLSLDCADCYAGQVLCMLENCIGSCLPDPNAASCLECVAEVCTPIWVECSGLSAEDAP